MTLDSDTAKATFALTMAQREIRRLSMPPDSKWFKFTTLKPIAPDGSFFWRLEWLVARPNRVTGTTVPVLAPSWASWSGYRVIGFGILLDPDAPPTGHNWIFVLPDRELRVQPWEARVFPRGSLLFGELEWRPGYAAARPLIAGLERPGYKQSHFKVAAHGLEMLFKLMPVGSGRPPGIKRKIKFRTPESYIARIHDLYQRAKNSGWALKNFGDDAIAKDLGVSRKTFDDRNAEYGITGDAIRAQRV